MGVFTTHFFAKTEKRQNMLCHLCISIFDFLEHKAVHSTNTERKTINRCNLQLSYLHPFLYDNSYDETVTTFPKILATDVQAGTSDNYYS